MLSEAEINYGFEKAENDLLRDALKRNYSERFHFLMNLMQMSRMLQRAKITQKPFPKTSTDF